MAARKPYTRQVMLTDEHRGKIAKSNILNALIEHAEGRREMSATQVTAGLGLLKKALPDLSAVEHSGLINTLPPEAMADDELSRIASTGGLRVTTPTNGAAKPH